MVSRPLFEIVCGTLSAGRQKSGWTHELWFRSSTPVDGRIGIKVINYRSYVQTEGTGNAMFPPGKSIKCNHIEQRTYLGNWTRHEMRRRNVPIPPAHIRDDTSALESSKNAQLSKYELEGIEESMLRVSPKHFSSMCCCEQLLILMNISAYRKIIYYIIPCICFGHWPKKTHRPTCAVFRAFRYDVFVKLS